MLIGSIKKQFVLTNLNVLSVEQRGKKLAVHGSLKMAVSLKDNPDIEGNEGYESDKESGDRKEMRLTLMEEVLLLGLKDKEVRVSCLHLT